MKTGLHERRLEALKNINQIRNVCIIAHVDHGKTTLSDNLLASNAIISEFQTGKLRYLDSREDEQEREITMKSSAISLIYKGMKVDQKMSEENKSSKNKKGLIEWKESEEEVDYLVNLIDSPGHVEFAFEVSTGLKVCDGAILVVDVIEGVCSQTLTNLKKAIDGNLTVILMVNKIDKLVSDMGFSPTDSYEFIKLQIDSVNAALSTALSARIIEEYGENGNDAKLEHLEHLYSFSPLKGNVIFGSAFHNWGFTIDDFLPLLCKKFKFKAKTLRKFLWGEYYFNAKTKKITLKPAFENHKPMFAEFILKNIYTIYDKIKYGKDVNWVKKMAKKLKITVHPFILNNIKRDWVAVVINLMGKWLPVSQALFRMIVRFIPNPKLSQKFRIFTICKKLKKIKGNKLLFEKMAKFKLCMEEADKDGPFIGFISKMNHIMIKNIDERGLPFTYNKTNRNEQKLIGFGRVFSGTLRRGDQIKLHILKKDNIDARGQVGTENKGKYEIVEIQINHIYIWMGQFLIGIEKAVSGMMVAFGDLDQFGFKTATLSSDEDCPPLTGLVYDQNLLKVSLKTELLSDMSKLVNGLKNLMKADPVIDVYYNESGNLILETGGEVHMERCLKDLEEDLGQIKVNISDPIITFKETIISRKWRQKKKKNIILKQIIKENEKAFIEDKITDNIHLKENKKEQSGEEEPEEEEEEKEMSEENTSKEKNPYYYSENTSSWLSDLSSDTDKSQKEEEKELTDQEIAKKAYTEWVDDDCDKEDHSDVRMIYNPTNFIFKKKKEEEVNVTKKGKNVKIKKVNFLNLKKKRNYCELTIPNGKYVLIVRAVGLEESVAQWLFSKKRKLNKLLQKVKNKNCNPGLLKFYGEFVKKLESSKMDPKLVKLIVRSIISFGPGKSGSNILCCRFVSDSDSMMGQFKDSEILKPYFKKSKRKQSSFNYKNEELMKKFFFDISFQELRHSLENGFNIALGHGPLCQEEMFGCIFIVEDFKSSEQEKERKLKIRKKYLKSPIKENDQSEQNDSDKITVDTKDQIIQSGDLQAEKDITETSEASPDPQLQINNKTDSSNNSENKTEQMSGQEEMEVVSQTKIFVDNYGPLSGQLASTMKQACHNCFLGAEPRLVQGVLLVMIYCEEQVYGKSCAVLNRRKGKILESDFQDLTNMFIIQALLPIQESFGFYKEMLITTSGRVVPQMSFKSWFIIEEDPFYEPVTKEELEEHGNKVYVKNYAKTLIEKIRERKGIATDKKVVISGAKQGNVSRKR